MLDTVLLEHLLDNLFLQQVDKYLLMVILKFTHSLIQTHLQPHRIQVSHLVSHHFQVLLFTILFKFFVLVVVDLVVFGMELVAVEAV